jgi:nucleoid-associated protein YgaU
VIRRVFGVTFATIARSKPTDRGGLMTENGGEWLTPEIIRSQLPVVPNNGGVDAALYAHVQLELAKLELARREAEQNAQIRRIEAASVQRSTLTGHWLRFAGVVVAAGTFLGYHYIPVSRPMATPAVSATPRPGVAYTVQPGDSLLGIGAVLSQMNESLSAERWAQVIIESNGVIRDPNLLLPGWVLTIPAAA